MFADNANYYSESSVYGYIVYFQLALDQVIHIEYKVKSYILNHWHWLLF